MCKLQGNKDIWQTIFDMMHKIHIDQFLKRFINTRTTDIPYMLAAHKILFPTPKNININMMPVILGNGILSSLPDEYKQYTNMILYNCYASDWTYDDNKNKKPNIGYLTIHEGFVDVGKTQRRPGLHIERPGALKFGGKWYHRNTQEYKDIAWGLGCWPDDGLPQNGIYMASTLNNSCAIWPLLIDNPEEVTDKHGGLEHMRHLLGKPRLLQANELCWFTDRTPHESLPVQPPPSNQSVQVVYRQFFRLVVGPISVWYSKHNTPNP